MKQKGTSARSVERSTRPDEFERKVQKRLAELEIEQDIIRLRSAAGLTQTELAQIAGVSQPFIAKLESGRAVNLELRTLVRIATALDAYVDTTISRRSKPAARIITPRKTAMAASAGRR